jgi:N utilization substance protein B
MANRHLARSIVMQTLFQLDFTGKLGGKDLEEELQKNISDFAPGMESDDFSIELFKGVLSKRSVLDEIIEKAAPDWPIEKINVVDRNILRLGLFELAFGDHENVPPKVAINEAIELAKKFGGESSGRFVNGVLGAIYKEMGEPGKEQGSVKTSKAKDIPVDEKAGAVVYAEHEGKTYFAMIHDVFGFWTLSKGSVEEGENPEDTVMREVMEEMGLPVVVKGALGENEYIANHPKKGKIKKHVQYFIAESPYQKIELEESGGLDDAEWFSFDEVVDLKMYDDITELIAKAITQLSEDK